MKLTWNRLPDGSGEVATGTDWVYLIVPQRSTALLTRCAPPGTSALAAAVAGAVNAFEVHPEFAAPEIRGSAAASIANARRIAQEYEDGKSLFGRPAWQHESGG